MQPTEFLKRHSLVIGIVLMFALTWPFYSGLGLFVGYGLALASLIMTGLTLGGAGVRALLHRFLIWRIGVQWYLLMLFGPAILLIVTLFHAAINTAYAFLPIAPSVTGDVTPRMICIGIEFVATFAVVVIAGPTRLSRLSLVKSQG